jgi:hypothetical protein
MFPLSRITRDTIIFPITKWIIPLAVGKGSRIGGYFQIAYYFLNWLILQKQFKGSTWVVKQLKSDQVALQKAIGGNPLSSLRELDPSHKGLRLYGGYPSMIKFISKVSYSRVRQGNPADIRL